MADLTIDRAQLEIVIKNDVSRKRMRELEEDTSKLKEQLKQIEKQGKKNTAAYKETQAAITRNRIEIDKLTNSIGLTGLNMDELRKKQHELNNIMKKLDPRLSEYKELDVKLKAVNGRIAELRSGSISAGTSMNGMASNFRKSYGTITAVTATITGFLYGIKKAIDLYYEEEKALKKVEQGIKSTGGTAGLSLKQLKQEATNLQKDTIFGDETILNDVTAQMLTFTNVTGNTFLRAQQASLDLSTVLEGDLKSASIMLGKALNDPVQGLTALRRVGVAFTDQQRAQIKELAESGRLMEAQSLILDELNIQYGGQAQAVAKGAGAITQMSNKISDAGETIGKFVIYAILPTIRSIGDLADKVNNVLNKAMQSSTEKFDAQLDRVIDLTDNILPLANRYDELISKSDRSTTEQNELNEIIKTISGSIPSAVTQFDAYGNAIFISTGRVRDFISAEQDRLKVVNAAAIKENQKKLKKIESDIAESYKKIKQIELTGTFEVIEAIRGTATLQPLIKRNAVQEEIQAEQEKYRELLSQRNGYNAEIERQSGDFLAKEQKRREDERKKAEENEKLKLAYQKKTLKELEKLKIEGDLFAEQELERRKSLDETKKSTEKAATAFEKLGNDIADARKQLLEYIRESKFLDAKQTGILLKGLEQQESIIKKIAENGGDVNKFLEELTDDTAALSAELDEDLFKKLEEYSWYIKGTGKKQESPDRFSQARSNSAEADAALAADKNKDLFGLTGDFNTNWYLDQVQTTSGAALEIWKNAQDAKLEYELNQLERARTAELANKNLTEKQKDAINEKYRKREASIKTAAFKKQQNADVIQAIINTALSVTRALATSNYAAAVAAGIAGAAQVAVIKSQPVPQYAKGKYQVTGADDNRTYLASWIGEPKTGIIARPSLIAENGGELIIDAPTTSNMMANAPQLIEAIYRMAGKIPQRASGKYDIDVIPGVNGVKGNSELSKVISNLENKIDKFNQTILSIQTKGLKSILVYGDYQDFSGKVDNVEDETNF